MSQIRLSPDGSTIIVFLPMAWRRRGGRKVIVAPPGCDDWAPPPRIDNTLVKALARAHRWQRLLESGAYGTLAEMADAERISPSSPGPAYPLAGCRHRNKMACQRAGSLNPLPVWRPWRPVAESEARLRPRLTERRVAGGAEAARPPSLIRA